MYYAKEKGVMLAFAPPKRRNGVCRGLCLSPQDLRFPCLKGWINAFLTQFLLRVQGSKGERITQWLRAVSAQQIPSILLSVHIKTIIETSFSTAKKILTQYHSNTILLVFILEVNMVIYKPGDIQNDKP